MFIIDGTVNTRDTDNKAGPYTQYSPYNWDIL